MQRKDDEEMHVIVPKGNTGQINNAIRVPEHDVATLSDGREIHIQVWRPIVAVNEPVRVHIEGVVLMSGDAPFETRPESKRQYGL